MQNQSVSSGFSGEQNVCTGWVGAGGTWEPGSGESHSLSQLSPAAAQLNEGLGIQALQEKQNKTKKLKSGISIGLVQISKTSMLSLFPGTM